MAIYLPLVNKMEVTGFDKIFKNEKVEIDFNKSLSILLGGNGLGKTTLLQCIIYALTGGLNSKEVESITSLRWNNDFFKKRVNPEMLATADIMMDFNLGSCNFQITRGINNNKITSLMVNFQTVDEAYFEEEVVQKGNYDNYDSFVFIVNRMLYLPESRRTLTWDYDAQVRTLMILSNDIIDEKKYRELRAEIKNLDSTKRHTTVRINKIAALAEKETLTRTKALTPERDEMLRRKNELSQQLQIYLKERENHSNDLKKYEERRTLLADEILKITNIIRTHEADFLSRSLSQYGEKINVLFEKAVANGICPNCGEKTETYKTIARERASLGECLVCGVKHHEPTHVSTSEIDDCNSQLNEKLIARDNANTHIIHLRNQIQTLDDNIFGTRKEVNTIDYALFINADNVNEVNSEEEFEDIEVEHAKLLSTRDSLESDIKIKTSEADRLYQRFMNDFEERYKRLSEIYKTVATSFLGKTVTLEYENSPDKFVEIKYFIPVFDEEARKNPEDCSEAQRFFLDIAFRLSLIVLNQELTGTSGTFVCETPESALDVSYVNNVVEMFFEFLAKDNKLILSNNIQKLGLAQLLVGKSKKENMQYSIFDLLEYGKLSEIQKNSTELITIRDEILRGI